MLLKMGPLPYIFIFGTIRHPLLHELLHPVLHGGQDEGHLQKSFKHKLHVCLSSQYEMSQHYWVTKIHLVPLVTTFPMFSFTLPTMEDRMKAKS